MQYNYVLGLMSGTSLDGVDLVYVKFDKLNTFEILASETVSYSQKWFEILKDVASISAGDKRLQELDVALGTYFSELILTFIESHQILTLDLIASHGHTVHHQPELGYTLQIGCGKEIYKRTNIKTVYNFRVQDVLLKGQGAPLVPVGDEILFSDYDYCLNLGGFSNVSFVDKGVRKAFDICPVNIVLNYYSSQLGFTYDDKGMLSRMGSVNYLLLEALNSLEFYKVKTPKSLGIEFVMDEIFPLILKFKLDTVDVLRTFVEHVSIQVAQKIKKGTVLVTGGGAYHQFLIERINFQSKNIELIIPSKEIIEYKEALIFGLLGKLRMEEKVNCLSSVTGSIKDHSSGWVVS